MGQSQGLSLKVEFLRSISDIKKSDWDSLQKNEYPFLKYDFLSCLEINKCVSPEKGWYPFHAVITENEALIGLMPIYLKTNSQGEFVFDWSWADAYYRNGLDYYPKIINSIPFTPAAGPRILCKEESQKGKIIEAVARKIQDLSLSSNFSSFHVLLPNLKELKHYMDLGFSIRTSNSYHWFNNDYESFEDFLNELTSRQRKNIRKEREKVSSQNIKTYRLIGREIKKEEWEDFYKLYQTTYYRRGMEGYLNLDFFLDIANKIPDNIMMVTARDLEGRLIASALNFFDDRVLYGRYWGTSESYDSLHFEVCYYQGIEFCIQNSLERFDPGVQGQHKIKRGFLPIETYSAHLIHDNRFKLAIDNFLEEEREHIRSFNDQCKEQLPFKKENMQSIYSRKVVYALLEDSSQKGNPVF